MEEKKILKIPQTIKTKTEFFVGFGISELVKTLIMSVIAIIIGYIVYLIKKETITPVLIVIITATVSVILFTKNTINFSLFDYILNIIKFNFTQKEYRYKRGGIQIFLKSKEVKK